ncbi:ABC transporter permease [Pelagicoccus mobilis]|uniref:ABC transporter permease n=1 Tax=Pelagicoccus mobilis TaxID=415221 RepID=A0A934VKN0_9BACT|nr:ABC transporter permease [Pelagicoccus mobilis]MBK1876861.1 ABC transporter permease [Pelagicoccus mobilis]
MFNDLQFGLRQLMKSPGFTLITVLTLAIGIGANTAIFSLINAYFLKALPYENADRLVAISYDTGEKEPEYSTKGKMLEDFAANSSQLESLIGFTNSGGTFTLTGIETPTELKGHNVTGPILATIGRSPILGTDFTPEHQTSDTQVVLLSEKAWKQNFNSDPNIVGRSIQLSRQSYRVLGVYDEKAITTFAWWQPSDLMVPASISQYPFKLDWDYATVAKLAPRATLASAQQELHSIKTTLGKHYSDREQESIVVVNTLRSDSFGHLSKPTIILLASVGLILLIACANVANLLFARATARQSELALRTAIGASGWRIVRLLLSESALLSLAGAAGGLIICLNTLPLLSRLVLFSSWPEMDYSIDLRVLAFTLVIGVGTGILFGVFPALKALSQGSAKGLSEASRTTTASYGNQLQSSLIITEIALSVVLLVSIGLLLKSTTNALKADRGFQESNNYNFVVSRIQEERPKNAPEPTQEEVKIERTRFSNELVERLKAIPSIENAAMVSQPPMDDRNGIWRKDFWRDDQPDSPKTYRIGLLQVNGDVFSILEIPLIRGRVFNESDQHIDAHKVALIDEQLEKEKFPDIDPIGQTIHTTGQAYQIIGIVGNITPRRLDEKRYPVVYTPQIHAPWNTSYIVKSHLSHSELERKIRETVKSIDPDQPIGELKSLEQLAKKSLNYRSVMNTLISLFGCVAVLLTSIGIYGLMTYLVEQRKREIGIRLAIGAYPKEIVSMIIKRGMFLTSIGAGAGIVATFLFGRFLAYLLYQVSPYDPLILASVALFVFIVTAVACWHPARTASGIHPSQALH